MRGSSTPPSRSALDRPVSKVPIRRFLLTHLGDGTLRLAMHDLAARARAATADLVAHIAEFDARRLFLPAGHPSMYLYCVHELHLSEGAALKHIRAARAARRFPAIFAALAEGRLHLSAVVLLNPHLTSENAHALLEAAAYRTRAEIEGLLAERFPGTELLPMVEALPASAARSNGQLSPGTVAADGLALAGPSRGEPASPQLEAQEQDGAGTHDGQLSPGAVETPAPRSRLTPLAPERFALHLTISKATHEKFRHARALLSHRLPSGDLASVLDLALDALVEKLEKRRFANTDTPRPRRRRTKTNPRHIPAAVKRAVWRRDGGRCTFVGDNGRRCNARDFLEFDHIEPVARGGQATVANLRLRCRAHNQHEAERTFGADFMREKRRTAGTAIADLEQSRDVMAALASLGVRAGEARRATELSKAAPGSTLEERVRAALRLLGPRPRVHGGITAVAAAPV